MNAAELILADVAQELEWLSPAPVFIGGSTIGLFLDALGRDQLRPTKDVDCIVPTVLSRTDWFQFEAELRHRGWQPDPDGPICRYRSPRSHTVDLLGARPEVQGFAGAWFERATRSTEQHVLSSTVTVTTPTLPYLLACKVEAFRHRGAKDPLASADLEDLVALLDGCQTLDSAFDRAESDVQRFIAAWCGSLILDDALRAAAEGQLPRGGDINARRQRFRARVRRLADLQTG